VNKIESILVQIGEFVCVEIDGIKDVVYGDKEDKTQNKLVILTDNNEEYILEIKQK